MNKRDQIECLNPNTGRKIHIDSTIYKVISKAIYHTLKTTKTGVTYTDIVKGVKHCLKQERIRFQGSIEWYTVTVKHNMEANNTIESFVEKGKKLHRLRK